MNRRVLAGRPIIFPLALARRPLSCATIKKHFMPTPSFQIKLAAIQPPVKLQTVCN
jgi:hypothetical protein